MKTPTTAFLELPPLREDTVPLDEEGRATKLRREFENTGTKGNSPPKAEGQRWEAQRAAEQCLETGGMMFERSEDSRFVGAGGDRSHAARTKFVPGGSPNRRHHKERRSATPIYAKRRVLLELVFS